MRSSIVQNTVEQTLISRFAALEARSIRFKTFLEIKKVAISCAIVRRVDGRPRRGRTRWHAKTSVVVGSAHVLSRPPHVALTVFDQWLPVLSQPCINLAFRPEAGNRDPPAHRWSGNQDQHSRLAGICRSWLGAPSFQGSLPIDKSDKMGKCSIRDVVSESCVVLLIHQVENR